MHQKEDGVPKKKQRTNERASGSLGSGGASFKKGSSTSSASGDKDHSDIECWNYKEKGHYRDQCIKLKSQSYSARVTFAQPAAQALAVVPEESILVIDAPRGALGAPDGALVTFCADDNSPTPDEGMISCDNSLAFLCSSPCTPA